MNLKIHLVRWLLCFACLNVAWNASAQSTAFTYQGHLTDGGAPATGTYDLQFQLRYLTIPDSTPANPITVSPVSVTNGLFTVILDFGADAFPFGLDLGLEIGVRTNGSSGGFTVLAPLQRVTATPYAIKALSTPFSGLTGFPVVLGNNTVGSIGNAPLGFYPNGVRAFLLEPTSNGAPNIIGGAPANSVAAGVVGATISGGGATLFNEGAFGPANSIASDLSTIGGGSGNSIQASSPWSTIGGGTDNVIQTNAMESMVGGGVGNTIQTNSYYAEIAGGAFNLIQLNAYESTIGGGRQNSIGSSAFISTIGGGNLNTIDSIAANSTISGGVQNHIRTNAYDGTIGGGFANVIQDDAYDSVIGGGINNNIGPSATGATIAGGTGNTIQMGSIASTIDGGSENSIQGGAWSSSIGGGSGNTIQTHALNAIIPGGRLNVAGGSYSFAAGFNAQAINDGVFVWADSTGNPFASTAPNQFLVRATGGVGINKNNPATTLDVNGTVTATAFNGPFLGTAAASTNFIGGLGGDVTGTQNATVVSSVGGQNAADVASAVIAANGASSALAANAIVKRDASGNFVARTITASVFSGSGAGLQSLNASQLATGIVPAAALSNAWQLGGNKGTTPGQQFIGTADNQPLEIWVNGSRALRLEPNDVGAPNVIGGALVNFVDEGTVGATISGGGISNYEGFWGTNSVSADFGTIGGGRGNAISTGATESTIGGGTKNVIQTNAFFSTIDGGANNTIQTNAEASSIGGGVENTIESGAGYSAIGGGGLNLIQIGAYLSTIGGGFNNTIQPDSYNSTIGGGEGNAILTNGEFAVIPGGFQNFATKYAFAAGCYAQATNIGAFVWSDGTGTVTPSTADYSVTMRASGGFTFLTDTNSGGAMLPAGGTSWATISDRNAKKNFQPVDSAGVLEKLAAIPVEHWNYKWEADDAVPHLGPVAQDFKAAFYPGRDEKSITTLEFDGVELAAIQGLNQKVEAQKAELEAKQAKIESLEHRLAKLEALVQTIAKR